MSLYHEAAEVLTNAKNNGGSLKSLTLGKKGWKSDAKTLFALTTETAKWSEILSEVVEKSGLLPLEKNLSPTLALLLAHDLLLAKKGVALPEKHGLCLSIGRHKARLTAELTKARLRRGVSSIDDLRKQVNSNQTSADGRSLKQHPRWIRINTLRTTLDEELAGTFSKFERVESLADISTATTLADGLIYIDAHVPNLIAIASSEEPTSFKSYKLGKLIFQEKASCFPAYLIGPSSEDGDIIDACAAPGNKTTHLAAVLANSAESARGKIIACEKDAQRSKTLSTMVHLANADEIVTIKPKQDFLRLDPLSPEFSNVTALLLDPSCSGSGIVGRDEVSIIIHLPSTSPSSSSSSSISSANSKSQKRKRGQPAPLPPPPSKVPPPIHSQVSTQTVVDPSSEEQDLPPSSSQIPDLPTRLRSLSTFQLRTILHAMSFPSAKKISYSTCSVHAEENERVVVRALLSSVAGKRGWKILERKDQVAGLRKWEKRGDGEAVRIALLEEEQVGDEEGEGKGKGGKGGKSKGRKGRLDGKDIAEGCIRCEKGGEEGTMGFFVAGFVRDDDDEGVLGMEGNGGKEGELKVEEEDDEEWVGFGDE